MFSEKTKTIVICVMVALLLAVAYPNYVTFNQRARASFAKKNLAAIQALQANYKGKYSHYARDFKALGWKPAQTDLQYYKYQICDSVIEGEYQITNIPLILPDYLVPCPNEGYYVYAVGNVDSDDILDIYFLSDKYGILHMVDDSDEPVFAGNEKNIGKPREPATFTNLKCEDKNKEEPVR